MNTVVCINVGGMVDLMDFFDLSSNSSCKWWILDSHRPLNLRNLFSSTQIVVIDDGTQFRSTFYPIFLGTVSDNIKELRKAFEAIEVKRFSMD